jgi:hypothetical protein
LQEEAFVFGTTASIVKHLITITNMKRPNPRRRHDDNPDGISENLSITISQQISADPMSASLPSRKVMAEITLTLFCERFGSTLSPFLGADTITIMNVRSTFNEFLIQTSSSV